MHHYQLRTGSLSQAPDFPALPPLDEAYAGVFTTARLTQGWGLRLTNTPRHQLPPELPPLGDMEPTGQITTAHTHGELAGYITFCYQPLAHLVVVGELRTLPALRRQLGTILLEHVQGYARDLAARGVYLEVSPRQGRTIQLCLAAGFELWAWELSPPSTVSLIAQRVRLRLGRGNAEAIPPPHLCLQLLHAYGLPQGIIHHSQLTAQAALLLAQELEAAGQAVDGRLVSAGALLHDIGKAQDQSRHHTASRSIVEAEGYPSLGSIVERHLTTLILTAEAPASWEEKLVFYADKVCTREVVSLGERCQDLAQRYRQQAGTIRHTLPALCRLEEEIFRHVTWPPRELPERVARSLGLS